MRIEEVVQIVVVVTAIAFIVTTMTQDWQSRLGVVMTMTPYFQYLCSVVMTMAFIVPTMTQNWQSRLNVVATMVATMTPCF